MAVWADLPSELLNSISDRLDILSCIRLSAVCTTFASTVRPCLPILPPFRLDQPIPWLLVFVVASKYKPDQTDFTFYDVTTTTFYCISSPIPFSSLDCPHWLGSNSGWLVFINLKFQLHLISPLTGVQLLLPFVKLPDGYRGNLTNYWNANQNSLERHSYEKVIICRMPDHDSGNATELFLLCLFRPQGLAVLKVGDDKWAWLDLERCYEDVILYEGKIYAIESYTLRCWELKGSSFKAEKVLTIKNIMLISMRKYLVASKDKLLMVCRNWNWGNGNHVMKVYKIDLDQRDRLWSPIKSIREKAVFIGLGYSLIASTIGINGGQENCIYYIHDDYIDKLIHNRLHSLYKSGVYNLKKEIYEHFTDFLPLTWFLPCDVK